MKTMKRMAGVLLALVMALALTVPAFGATVENATDHTYEAYQIFKGTQAESSAPLGDVEWGSGIQGDAFLTALKADDRFNVGDANIFASCTTAASVAKVLSGYGDKSDVAKAFANVAAQKLTTTSTPIAKGATSVSLSAGYYLLVDTGAVSGSDAYNSALLQVTNKGNVTIEEKYNVPTVDKDIMVGDEEREADDAHIGDSINFRITGTLPSNYADYETYFYQFNDTLSAGLKYNGDAKVYVVNGSAKAEIQTGFVVDPAQAATTGGGTLTITCNDLKAISGVTINENSTIVVEYTAELTADAKIGQPGNENKVTLKYSNNPNQTGSGAPSTSDTPEDKVLVFTYELDVTKVDGQDKSIKLKDAEFVLLKSDKSMVAEVANGKFVKWVAVPAAVDGTITYPEGTKLTSDINGKFIIAGLDADTYYLQETKAPAGYNLVEEPVKIVISATVDKSEDNPALTALTITVDNGTEVAGDLASGVVSTDVVNNIGTVLPETGGMGTTLFYILGSVLVLGAGVLLVVKKRMGADK